MTRIVIFSACLASLLVGCATPGANFSAPEPAPADKGLVYFYRPFEWQGGGVTRTIADNNKPIVELQAGRYIKFVVEPGQHTFSVVSSMAEVKPVDIPVKPGETYYVRYGLRTGLLMNTLFLTRVYPEEATPELRECCKNGQ